MAQLTRRLFNLSLCSQPLIVNGAIGHFLTSSNALAHETAGIWPRSVFAHWHFFRTSFDNAPPGRDTYATYLSPTGLNGRYRDIGGFLRDRPLPRPQIAAPNWAILDMINEIKWAVQAGLNGFQLNILGIDRKSQHPKTVDDMLAAAEACPPFAIMLSLDAVALGTTVSTDDLARELVKWATSSSVARDDKGRLLLGSFAAERWRPDRWRSLIDAMGARGEVVSFHPHFLDVSQADKFFDLITGCSVWGGNHFRELEPIQRFSETVRNEGKEWIAPVYAQDFRPKGGWFAEARNSELFRAGWHLAMETKAQMVSVATWNDYSEGSEIRPSEQVQYAFSDLNSFYASWFVQGKRPEVNKDILYYFHRIEGTENARTGSSQSTRFFSQFGETPDNEIELLAFLKAPGQLTIQIGDQQHRRQALAGFTSMKVPLVPGRPVFTLARWDKELIRLASAFEIRDASLYQDLLYRGGSSDRPPVL